MILIKALNVESLADWSQTGNLDDQDLVTSTRSLLNVIPRYIFIVRAGTTIKI